MKALLVRADGTPDDDARALRARGVEVVTDPYIQIVASDDADAVGRADAQLRSLAQGGGWLIVTSAAAMRALDALLTPEQVTRLLAQAQEQGARFAAVGPASSAALSERGVPDVLVPTRAHTAAALLECLADVEPSTAVLPRSSLADPIIASTLESRGWAVMSEEVYRTSPVELRPRSADELADGAFDVLVLRSPSAARAVARFSTVPTSTAIVTGGPTTAHAARELGMHVTEVAVDSRAASIASAVLAAGDRVAASR